MISIPSYLALRLDCQISKNEYKHVPIDDRPQWSAEYAHSFIAAGSAFYQTAMKQMVDVAAEGQFGYMKQKLAELGTEKVADIAEWTIASCRAYLQCGGPVAACYQEMLCSFEDLIIGHIASNYQEAEEALRFRGRSPGGGPLQAQTATAPCQRKEPGIASSSQIEACSNVASSVDAMRPLPPSQG